MKRNTATRVLERTAASLSCLIALIGTASAQLSVIWTVPDADPYIFVEFSHDDTMLAAGHGSGNTSSLLSVADGSLIRNFTGQHNTTNAVVFTHDDSFLITGNGSSGSTLSIASWVVATGQRYVGPLGDHTNGTQSVTMSPDGQYVATSGRFDRDINIRHVPDLALVLEIPNQDPHAPGGPNPRVKDVDWAPNGQMIASSDIYGLKVRRPADGSLIYSVDIPEAQSIAFSPDGLYLAAAIESEQQVKLFKAATGKFVRAFPIGGTFDFPVIAFAPSGRILVAGYNVGNDGGALKFWNVSTGATLLSENRSGAIKSIAFSPGGERMAFTQFDGLIVMAKALSGSAIDH